MSGEPATPPGSAAAASGDSAQRRPRPWTPAAAMEPVPPLAPPPARPGAGTPVAPASEPARRPAARAPWRGLVVVVVAGAAVLVVVLLAGR